MVPFHLLEGTLSTLQHLCPEQECSGGVKREERRGREGGMEREGKWDGGKEREVEREGEMEGEVEGGWERGE